MEKLNYSVVATEALNGLIGIALWYSDDASEISLIEAKSPLEPIIESWLPPGRVCYLG